MSESAKSGGELFIVDNSDESWKGLKYLQDWTEIATAFDIAAGYFEIGALLALDGKWQKLDKIRILMGDEASARTRQAILQGLQEKIKSNLDASIEAEKEKNDFLSGVDAIVAAMKSGKIECRVYAKRKFHAKAYITHPRMAVIGSVALVGSSNFTVPGLTQNIELNIQIRAPGDVAQLQEWFERHWLESEEITPQLIILIERQIQEYTPFEIYVKALRELFTRHELTANEWEQRESKLYPVLDHYQRDGYKSLVGIASLERLIEQNKERYYETLEECSQHWHEGKHDPWPYLNYLLFILTLACKEFEERLGNVKSPRGEKTESVVAALKRQSSTFRLADLQTECPGVGVDLIRQILARLQKEKKIRSLGTGRSAKWGKILN